MNYFFLMVFGILLPSTFCYTMYQELALITDEEAFESFESDDRSLRFLLNSLQIEHNGWHIASQINVLSTIIPDIYAHLDSQYTNLEKLWSTCNRTPSHEWCYRITHLCQGVMASLLKLLSIFTNEPILTLLRENNVRPNFLLAKIFNLYEKIHSLRIKICTLWVNNHKNLLKRHNLIVQPLYIDKYIEELCQYYIRTLDADLSVDMWFHRMREKTIHMTEHQ